MDKKDIKIMVVDDHPLYRKGLKTGIESLGYTVVAEASNGQEFIEMIDKFVCDIVILDIKMPVMNGIEATKTALNKYPDLRILVLSNYESENYLHDVLAAGVKGFSSKDIDVNELNLAIQMIMDDNIYLSKEFQTTVNKFFISAKHATLHLTNREIEVLDSVVKGLSNKKIAQKLSRDIRTIEGHKCNLLKKTNTQNSAELTAFAIKNNLVETQE